jgi:hypothetical protein
MDLLRKWFIDNPSTLSNHSEAVVQTGEEQVERLIELEETRELEYDDFRGLELPESVEEVFMYCPRTGSSGFGELPDYTEEESEREGRWKKRIDDHLKEYFANVGVTRESHPALFRGGPFRPVVVVQAIEVKARDATSAVETFDLHPQSPSSSPSNHELPQLVDICTLRRILDLPQPSPPSAKSLRARARNVDVCRQLLCKEFVQNHSIPSPGAFFAVRVAFDRQQNARKAVIVAKA